MFRLPLSTNIMAHEWRGANKESPVIRTRLGEVVWYTWNGHLIRVEKLNYSHAGSSENWFLDSGQINMKALFPGFKGNMERLTPDDLHFKLAALIAQYLTPRIDTHITKILQGE